MNIPFSRRVLTALFWMASIVPLAGCAPETALCEADGAKFYTPTGLNVYVNPVLFLRVYGGEQLETSAVFTLTNTTNNMVLASGPMPPQPFGADPGGVYLCTRTSQMGSARTGLGPFPFMRNERFSLSIRVVTTESTGRVQTFTLPVTRYKTLEEDMPGFTCGSTHCGR
jgi:hypothetical protein